MKKKSKKAVKAKPKSKRNFKAIGECMLWNGNVYTIMTFETMTQGRFEKVELKAVRALPIEI
jgi:hypothetical protein